MIIEIPKRDCSIAVKRTYFEQMVFCIFSEMACGGANNRTGIKKTIKLKVAVVDNEVVIRIHNNYLLIPGQLAHNYMNLFCFQKHPRKNLSVGQPLIKNFVNLLGGAMTLKNNNLGGCTYTIKFPRYER